MSRALNITGVLVITLLSLLLLTAVSCKANSAAVLTPAVKPYTTKSESIAPYIPPAYYQCTEVLPMDLENAFYSACWDDPNANATYGGTVFVFKNLVVDASMIRDVDKGWLWADLIKCPVINIDYARNIKLGEGMDIVGVCVGRDLTQSPGLVFRDCYVFQSGLLQLPAPGGGATFTPMY